MSFYNVNESFIILKFLGHQVPGPTYNLYKIV